MIPGPPGPPGPPGRAADPAGAVSKHSDVLNQSVFCFNVTLPKAVSHNHEILTVVKQVNTVFCLSHFIYAFFFQVKKYASLRALIQSYVVEDGTLSFVTETSKLYIKVPGGWREVQVSVRINEVINYTVHSVIDCVQFFTA